MLDRVVLRKNRRLLLNFNYKNITTISLYSDLYKALPMTLKKMQGLILSVSSKIIPSLFNYCSCHACEYDAILIQSLYIV